MAATGTGFQHDQPPAVDPRPNGPDQHIDAGQADEGESVCIFGWLVLGVGIDGRDPLAFWCVRMTPARPHTPEN